MLLRIEGLVSAGPVLIVVPLRPAATLADALHPGLSQPWHPMYWMAASLPTWDLSIFLASSLSLAFLSLVSRIWLSSIAASAILFS